MNFPSVHTEGGLIPADVLDAIAADESMGIPRPFRTAQETMRAPQTATRLIRKPCQT